MDVARRGEPADLSGSVRAVPVRDEALCLLVEREKLLVLDPLHDTERAPRHVIVDPGHLPRPPDQRDDREGAVGLDMKHMASVPPRVTGALLVAQHGRRGKTALQFGSNEPSRLPPVLAPGAPRPRTAVTSSSSSAPASVVLLSANLRLTVTNEVLVM